MKFDDHFIEELKARVRPSDLIGKVVKLRRQGREYVGLSPFTKEKTPSFFVNDDKGFFYDFSSGKHGDVISFLQETERLSFAEAVERLASHAGIALPATTPREAEAQAKVRSLVEWIEVATGWFEAELRAPAGESARAYLLGRGIPEAEWSRFRVGYAPNHRTALRDYLVSKGASANTLVQAGLLIKPEDGGAPYDRFRDRIMFRIADARARAVSFGGRALNPDARAKYLNGPDTDVFHKGRVLYGLPEARRLLHEGGTAAPLVVVEGYFDVIACHRAGVAAVAPMGTALTEDQMDILWRQHHEPTLCFDSDAAGQRAADRTIDRALPLLKPGKSFRFVTLSRGKDPDDILRESSAEALVKELSKTVPFVQRLFDREKNAELLDTPERRAGLKVRLRQVCSLIDDRELRFQYQRELLDRFQELFPRSKFIPGWGKQNWNHEEFIRYRDAPERLKSRAKPLNASLAVAAVRSTKWLLEYVEEFAVYGFADDQLSDLKGPLMKALTANKTSPDVVEYLIEHTEGAEAVWNKAHRIAFEVTPLPFLTDATPSSEAHRMWRRAMDAVMEVASLTSELDGNRIGMERPGYFETRKALRDRVRHLRKQLSDLTVWEDEAPSNHHQFA